MAGLSRLQASAGRASTSCRSWWMTVPASPQEILDITAVGRTLRRRSLSTEEAMMARNTSSLCLSLVVLAAPLAAHAQDVNRPATFSKDDIYTLPRHDAHPHNQ